MAACHHASFGQKLDSSQSATLPAAEVAQRVVQKGRAARRAGEVEEEWLGGNRVVNTAQRNIVIGNRAVGTAVGSRNHCCIGS